MSSTDEKMAHSRATAGRPSCFLHEHLAGAVPIALDIKTREPTLVAFQAMDRLQVWVVFQRVMTAEDRKRGQRCELVSEYQASWCSDTRAWVDWRLVRELWTPDPNPTPRTTPAPHPATVTTFPAKRQPRKKPTP